MEVWTAQGSNQISWSQTDELYGKKNFSGFCCRVTIFQFLSFYFEVPKNIMHLTWRVWSDKSSTFHLLLFVIQSFICLFISKHSLRWYRSRSSTSFICTYIPPSSRLGIDHFLPEGEVEGNGGNRSSSGGETSSRVTRPLLFLPPTPLGPRLH